MVIEYFESQLYQLFKSNPHVKRIEPMTTLGHATSTLKVVFTDDTVIRVDLHRLPAEEPAKAKEEPVCLVQPVQVPELNKEYKVWGMKVRVLRIETKVEDSYVVFEEVGQSAPTMALPLHRWQDTIEK